jgi:hypothetical protein
MKRLILVDEGRYFEIGTCSCLSDQCVGHDETVAPCSYDRDAGHSKVTPEV